MVGFGLEGRLRGVRDNRIGFVLREIGERVGVEVFWACYIVSEERWNKSVMDKF